MSNKENLVSIADLANGERIQLASSAHTADAGTPFENRSLPYVEGSQEYNSYNVVKPIDGVLQGRVAGAFNQPGGGMQQRLPESVGYYIDNGHLERR